MRGPPPERLFWDEYESGEDDSATDVQGDSAYVSTGGLRNPMHLGLWRLQPST